MNRPDKAEKVRHFLETYCIQSKYPWNGKALQLQSWQWKEVVQPIYGTYNEDGTRRFKRAGIWVP